MPEIGECYTIARKLNEEKMEVKTVKLSSRFNSHILKTPLFKINSLEGMKINQVFAYGKSVWFEFLNKTDRVIMVSQLGMSGSWFIDDHGRNKNNDHITFVGKKHILRYSDPRMFGKMRFFGFKKSEKNWKSLVLENFNFGVDPLNLTAHQLSKLLKESWGKKNKAIKLLTLDQDIVFGIGNYLASEMLYAAKIHPETPGSHITDKEYDSLAKEILRICHIAVDSGGHSFAEGFFHPDGSTGTMGDHIKIYGKEGSLCDLGHTIKKMDLGGRSTYLCPGCQKIK